MFTNNRDAYRQAFFDLWQKHLKKLPLEPFEAQLLEVVMQHPEYHSLLEQGEKHLQQEYAMEENPFFHMGLHLSVREQIALDRPAGITACYERLKEQSFTGLEAEHKIMEVLIRTMWRAQQTGVMDEKEYLAELNKM